MIVNPSAPRNCFDQFSLRVCGEESDWACLCHGDLMCLVMSNPFPIPGSIRDILCGIVSQYDISASIGASGRGFQQHSLVFRYRAWGLPGCVCCSLFRVDRVDKDSRERIRIRLQTFERSTSSPVCPFPFGLVDQIFELFFRIVSVIFTLPSSMMKSKALRKNRGCGRPQASHSIGWNGMQLFFIHFRLNSTI